MELASVVSETVDTATVESELVVESALVVVLVVVLVEVGRAEDEDVEPSQGGMVSETVTLSRAEGEDEPCSLIGLARWSSKPK